MRSRLLLGQSLCIVAMFLLLASIPLLPRVSGLPKHRILEMSLFWASFGLLILGGGRSLGSVPRRVDFDWRPALAAAGITLAAAVCVAALSNLLFSSLQGAGWRPPGVHSGTLYPRELGYALFLPLLMALGCQLPILGLALSAPSEPPPSRWRMARIVLLTFLVILFLLFGGSCLLFFVDRWFAVVSVTITWLASFLVLGVAIDQIVWALARS